MKSLVFPAHLPYSSYCLNAACADLSSVAVNYEDRMFIEAEKRKLTNNLTVNLRCHGSLV